MAGGNTDDLVLYCHPISYYSRRVLMILEEKELKYKKVMVGLDGQNLQPWYLKINPKGEIPAITHGDRNVYDSNAVIDYLEESFPEAKRLLAEKGTIEGDKVQRWRNRINDIGIEAATTGCIMFREMYAKDAGTPPGMSKLITERKKATMRLCETLTEKFPEYAEFYQTKLKRFRDNSELMNGERGMQEVERRLEEMDTILNEMENQLQETRNSFPDGDHWFLGQDFTAADVYLAVLLDRLKYLGLAHHFRDHMPFLTAYLDRLNQRRSFRLIVSEMSRFFRLMMFRKLIAGVKKMALPVAGLIAAVAAAWIYVYNYSK
ncbi:ganglioside-induced differentiation-associated protein 1-like [Ptychodera flava]|uniref:ganglioside-induced differentiation-associated protein 1-like n=1 Tax=Ptychodera flava TaxID=63121 RepID=UPI00396A0BD6